MSAVPQRPTEDEDTPRIRLDLGADVVALTAGLIDIPSESGGERAIADAVEDALRGLGRLDVSRIGNAIVAATRLGLPERVLIGGHLDTVPAAGNVPHRLDGDRLGGLGAADMKGGVAVALRLAASVDRPRRDVTYVFYDCEEVEAARNGLARLAGDDPGRLACDMAILMEPSNCRIEAGCQGSIRADLTMPGERAHSARSWLGRNAIHGAATALRTLDEYRPRTVSVAGLEYREGLNAVRIVGGVAGNVIPDECVVTVNYRFAPDLSPDDAERHLRSLFPGVPIEITDVAPAAPPGLESPAVQRFVRLSGASVAPKLGWTDVARFAALGIPAVNFGPGDPHLAHTPGEYVTVDQLHECERVLRRWLEAADG